MRAVQSTLAAAAVAAAVAFAPVKEAKAEPGVIIGVGAYLLADAVVGAKCGTPYWPFNIVKKVAYRLRGVASCDRYRYGEAYGYRSKYAY